MTEVFLPAISQDTGLGDYIKKVSQFPYLSVEDEVDLAVDYRDNDNVKSAHKLVTSHLRLVVKIAMGYRGYGLPMNEVISEGNIGLMQAVKKFDPDKGFRLATYAMWWIKASIQEYILKSWSLVKIGTTAAQKKLFFNLRKIKNRLSKVDNKSLTDEDIKHISTELDVSEKEVVEMDKRISFQDKSLNSLMIDSEETSGEMIDFLEETDPNQEAILIEKDESDWQRSLFLKAFEKLNDREKDIITKRRLQDNAETLDELSISYNISRERVRQIEARALEKVKEYISQSMQ